MGAKTQTVTYCCNADKALRPNRRWIYQIRVLNGPGKRGGYQFSSTLRSVNKCPDNVNRNGPLIVNLHCEEVVQPLLRRSIDNLRLLSAAAAASPPLLFRPPLPPPPPMNTLVTCVFRPRSEADAVAGDGLRHGAEPLTGETGLAAAVAAGFGRGRLREVMTWIMTCFDAEAVPLFRTSVVRLSSRCRLFN